MCAEARKNTFKWVNHVITTYKNVYFIVTPWALRRKKKNVLLQFLGVYKSWVLISGLYRLKFEGDPPYSPPTEKEEEKYTLIFNTNTYTHVHQAVVITIQIGLRLFRQHMTLSQLYMSILLLLFYFFCFFGCCTQMVLYVYMVLFALLWFALLCYGMPLYSKTSSNDSK